MLRLVGQASKQSSQALAPVALNSRCLAAVGADATPRTPRTLSHAASETSPLKRNQATSPFFANQDGPASPTTPKTPSCCTGAGSTERSPFLFSACGNQDMCQDVHNASPTRGSRGSSAVTDESLDRLPSPMRIRARAVRAPTLSEPSLDCAVEKRTLLGRLAAHTTAHLEEPGEPDAKADAENFRPNPESVRQAVLSRQTRVADRSALRASAKERNSITKVLLGRESEPQPLLEGPSELLQGIAAPTAMSVETESASAQLAHDAFMARMASRSGRRMAARM